MFLMWRREYSCIDTGHIKTAVISRAAGVAEMMAGPYRDGYVLAFIRERPHTVGGGLEVAQLIAPPNARAYAVIFSHVSVKMPTCFDAF
jgi:hypothetical protein